MAKQTFTTCGACGYEWRDTKGALPVTAACPCCGEIVPEVQARLDERAAAVEAANTAAKPEA